MKQLLEKNLRLKRLVAELTPHKAMLRDVLSRKCRAFAAWTDDGAQSQPVQI